MVQLIDYLMVFLKEIFDVVYNEGIKQIEQKYDKLGSMQRVN